jgi:LysM repeat protein
VTKALLKQSSISTIGFFVSGVMVLGIPAAYARAGIFSSIAHIFEAHAGVTGARLRQSNSQTIPLLRAALNPDPNPSKGGGDIAVVGGNALVYEVGPSGTLANIDKNILKSDQISLYVVREGDSLSAIAHMFGVSKNTIIWANDIKRGSLITMGQTLIILPVSGVTHTVRAGDTLATIAKKYGGNMEEISSFNNFDPGTALAAGSEVIIPDGEIVTVPPSRQTSLPKAQGGKSGLPAYSGYFMRPVDGVKTQGIHGYNGVDIAAAPGSQIVAAAAGEVLIARSGGWNGGYGNYIVVKHENGTQTLYAHTARNLVAVGESVVQGQVIAYVGSTGKSTGPHLHFEVRGAVNPF